MSEKTILNHPEHLAKLMKQAETNRLSDVKKLLDYLILYKASK